MDAAGDKQRRHESGSPADPQQVGHRERVAHGPLHQQPRYPEPGPGGRTHQQPGQTNLKEHDPRDPPRRGQAEIEACRDESGPRHGKQYQDRDPLAEPHYFFRSRSMWSTASVTAVAMHRVPRQNVHSSLLTSWTWPFFTAVSCFHTGLSA